MLVAVDASGQESPYPWVQIGSEFVGALVVGVLHVGVVILDFLHSPNPILFLRVLITEAELFE